MIWRVEIQEKKAFPDALGQSVLGDIKDLKINSLDEVRVVSVYLLEGTLTKEEADRIARELLVDPIVQEYRLCNAPSKKSISTKTHVVEIAYNTGVMEPTESSTLKGIRDLKINTVTSVRTARQYILSGKLSSQQLKLITERVLMNKLIQHAVQEPTLSFTPTVQPSAVAGKVHVLHVDLLGADDAALMQISSKGQLYLNINEMRVIQAYFKKEGRNPTDVELETIAQTWSEHCNHKTFRGRIRYTYKDSTGATTTEINNLFKSTIARATNELKKDWCVSVFHDNAGVIEFDDQDHVCFKVETHNHPSALEPFGGANTGVGGVIRDTLGTGLAAKPLGNTDVFCFAPPDFDFAQLPAGTLHPKRVMKGVVSGVRDYGNKMGIPTVNGAVLFDERFVGNPLVFCGNVGLIPKGKEFKKVNPGDLIVAVGGRTGRDGIHGATFSSGELTSESETISSGAVQIGNPIEEKKVLDALLKARDLGLYTAITDCGAGGFSSAVGEMGATTGARVDLDKAPLKYQGLKYHEIWISESQERMVMSVPAKNINKLLNVFTQENVEATVIGEFDSKPVEGRLRLFYHGVQVADLDMHFLHEGVLQIAKDAVYEAPTLKKEVISTTVGAKGLTQELCAVLSDFNVASKESIVRVYDHEVQGTSVIKPFAGIKADGPSDAAVLRPKLSSHKGIAIANGINIRYGMIDPYWMAAACVDEAIRQVVAVGANPKRVAILDNFCWGNPDKPDRLGSLVRAAQACYDAALAYGAPYISGKDSLYNEYTENGKSLAIPGTILISSLAIVDDVRQCVSMDFKNAGNVIYVIGATKNELGGSVYLKTLGQLGVNVPRVDFKAAPALLAQVHHVIQLGFVRACHDVSEGGLGVALAEMAFAGGLGATILLSKVPRSEQKVLDEVILFSESTSRFVVEVKKDKCADFEKALGSVAFGRIGTVEASGEFLVYGQKDNVLVNAHIDDLKKAWQQPLRTL